MAFRPRGDPDRNAFFGEPRCNSTPRRGGIAFVSRSRAASRMNQHEPLCLFAIQNAKTRGEPSNRERRWLKKRPVWNFHIGRKRLDERGVPVISRNVWILEFDMAIDEQICELARDASAKSVANRRPG